ncbi:hypothetical protein OH77DRAFT_958459 [Trametes cingulata]|nr:hypothetical protein OH77DRAFT_958459 [Trametes cingulata]
MSTTAPTTPLTHRCMPLCPVLRRSMTVYLTTHLPRSRRTRTKGLQIHHSSLLRTISSMIVLTVTCTPRSSSCHIL